MSRLAFCLQPTKAPLSRSKGFQLQNPAERFFCTRIHEVRASCSVESFPVPTAKGRKMVNCYKTFIALPSKAKRKRVTLSEFSLLHTPPHCFLSYPEKKTTSTEMHQRESSLVQVQRTSNMDRPLEKLPKYRWGNKQYGLLGNCLKMVINRDMWWHSIGIIPGSSSFPIY